MPSVRIHSLTTRFLLTLLLSTALPFLVFGWYARSEMERRLESQVVEVFLPDQAVAAAEEIQARLLLFDLGCKTLRNKLMNLLRKGDTRDFEMEVDLTDFDPDVVLLVGAGGKVIEKKLHPRLDSKTRDTSAKLLPESVADAGWYRQIVAGQGQVWEDHRRIPQSRIASGCSTLSWQSRAARCWRPECAREYPSSQASRRA